MNQDPMVRAAIEQLDNVRNTYKTYKKEKLILLDLVCEMTPEQLQEYTSSTGQWVDERSIRRSA